MPLNSISCHLFYIDNSLLHYYYDIESCPNGNRGERIRMNAKSL